MHPYVQLFLAGLLPGLLSVVFYALEKKTKFQNWNYWLRQILIGLVFGGIAVLGTEFGVSIVGVTMNVRDAAPLCAGLIFGAPAGIISGVIGGVERYVAAAWGAGAYSKVACSVATCFAGFYAAGLRKFMFEDKKPAWYYGFIAGAITEVLHMLVLFLTHVDDARQALIVVQKCAMPMIFMCAVSVTLALVLVSLLAREPLLKIKEKAQISQIFQRRLLVLIVIAFTMTSWFSFKLQAGMSENAAQQLMGRVISDIEADITQTSDDSLLSATNEVAKELDEIDTEIDTDTLTRISVKYDVSEINVVDQQGIITASTAPQVIGFDMTSGEQSREFMALVDGKTKGYVQPYGPISFDPNVFRKYAAVPSADGGFIQVGYNARRFQADVSKQVQLVTCNRHVGETGYVVVYDHLLGMQGTSFDPGEGRKFDDSNIWQDADGVEQLAVFLTTMSGEEVYAMYDICEGYYIVVVYPVAEAQTSRDLSLFLSVFIEVLIFTALFIFIYIIIKDLIVKNIRKINAALGEITNGNLETVVDVRKSEEFASLSDDINSTVTALKHYIAEAAARIDKELEFASNIQTSALPRVFPPYPSRQEQFDIWASMTPAKEVGGDFYDFYMIGQDKLAILIADVSGKGIPAAMFMMTAKTLIKSFAESGETPDQVFTHANDELAANNDAGMFVTAWLGILDLKTGKMTFVNAGHNPPLVRRGDGSFEYLQQRHGFVLAPMEGVKYRSEEMELAPGDVVYLYTDGVTEATNGENQLFGEERLLGAINALPRNSGAEQRCRAVKAAADQFVGEAPQFDDMTMLCLEFKGKMKEEEK